MNLLREASKIKLAKECNSPQVEVILNRQFIGNLIYLSHSKLENAFDVSLLSRSMQSLSRSGYK